MKATQAATSIGQEEQAIRELVDNWLEASKKHDLPTMLDLLDDDVLFIVPGREPFGKKEFAAHHDEMKDVQMEAVIDIKEVKVMGEWAWMRSFLKVALKPVEGDATKLSGHILTILRKTADGKWVICRDANFVMPESTK